METERPSIEPALGNKLSGELALILPCAAGFAFFRVWWSELQSEGIISTNPGFTHLGVSYWVFLVVSIVCFIVLALLANRGRIADRYGQIILSSPALLIAAFIAMVATILSNDPGFSLIGSALCGVGFSVVSLQWIQLQIEHFSNRLVLSLIVGFIAAAIISTAMKFVPSNLSVPFYSACPLISAMLMQAFLISDKKAAGEMLEKPSSAPFSRSMLVKLLVFSFMITVAVTLNNLYTVFELSQMSQTERGSWNLVMGTLSLAFSLLIIAFMGFLFVYKRESLGISYKLLVILTAIGGLLIVVPGFPLWAYFLFTAGSRYCFEVFLWVFFLLVAVGQPKGVGFFLTTRATVLCGLLAGMLLRFLLVAFPDFATDDQGHFIIISVLVVSIMLLTYIFVFSDSTLLKVLQEDNRQPTILETLNDRLLRIAAQSKMSERETEVFLLLAKGRDNPYIQKELNISQGTVGTYKQRIYKKLDVHKHQELIDLVYENDP